jgi:hypothetical protein
MPSSVKFTKVATNVVVAPEKSVVVAGVIYTDSGAVTVISAVADPLK